MYDDHEHEHDLDQPPEGSIVTPIFLGCGAMGLGCLFSGALIAAVLALFAPGLIDALRNIEDPFVTEAFQLVEVHPEVIAAIGEPMEHELLDIDVGGDEPQDVTFGDVVEMITDFSVTGPLGSADVRVESLQEISLNGDRQLRSVIVTLEDGRMIRVFPADGDVPPPPQQLAPPGENDGAPGVINIPFGGGSDSTGDTDDEEEPAPIPDVPEKAPSP